MDDFFAGLFCAGVAGFLPLLGFALWSVFAVRRLRAEVERLGLAVSELQAMAVPGALAARSPAAKAPAPLAAPAPAAGPVLADGGPAAAPAAAPAVGEPPVEAPAAARAASPPKAPPPKAPPPKPPGIQLPPPPPPTPVDLGQLIERGAVWGAAGLGGLALVVAVLFGLREAIAHGLLGPVARFAGGVAVALGAWVVAELLHWRKYPTPAAALSGAGAAILYGTLYAGHGRWGIIGQAPTFALMCGVTAVGMLLAERRDSRFIAWMSMFGGYATPLLLATGDNQAVAFFGYLALVDVGLLVVAARRRWPDLLTAAGLATLVLYLGWTVSFRAPDQVPVALGGAFVFAALWLGSARPRGDTLADRFGAVAAVAIGLAFWLVAALFHGTPTDPLAIDPVSSLPLPWDLGASAWFGGAWVLLGALVLPALARGNLPARLAAGGVVGLGALAFVGGWVLAGEPRWDVVVPVVVLAPILAWVAGPVEPGAAVLVAVGAAAFAVSPFAPVPAERLPWLTLGLAGGAVVGALRSGSRVPWALLAVLGPAPLYGGLLDRVDGGELGALALATLPLYLVLAVGPFVTARRGDLWGALAGVLAPLTLAWPLLVVWRGALGGELDGVLPLLLAANALLGALVLVRAARSHLADKEVVLLIAVTLVGVALAVPLQLETTWMTVGWAVLVALLAWVNRRVPHPLFVGFATVLAAVVAGRLLLNPWALEYGRGEGAFLVNWTLYTWGIPTVCLLLAARWSEHAWLRVALRTIAILTGFALVNLEIAHAFARDGVLSFHSERLGEEMVRSISWGGYGLFLVVLGIRRRSRAVRLGGLGFAVLGAGKVFVVDLWSLSGFARVGAFFGMAVTLLAAAVAFAWLVRNDQPSPRRDEEPPA